MGRRLSGMRNHDEPVYMFNTSVKLHILEFMWREILDYGLA
jgi:hypothetical protein